MSAVPVPLGFWEFGRFSGALERKKPRGVCSGVCSLIWLRGQDLNLRPSGYEPDELPGCSTPRQLLCSFCMPKGRVCGLLFLVCVEKLTCDWQTWQRPTLPRLKTKYHRRWGVSRPCSERERVQPPRHDHQVGKAHVIEKLVGLLASILSLLMSISNENDSSLSSY